MSLTIFQPNDDFINFQMGCHMLLTPAVGSPQWPVQLGIQLIRENVAGLSVVHDRQIYNFNPDEGLKRRAQFVRNFGYRAENLIKALGEGDGGYAKLDDGQSVPFIPFRSKQVINGIGEN